MLTAKRPSFCPDGVRAATAPRKRRRATPYHRDDLRGELLAAGRSYVGRHGHIDLSIRMLAQSVGVSPGAPYHHFPDRRSLLLAIAIDGFREMMATATVVADCDSPPKEKLREMGRVFIRFADANPHLIELMYESELTTPTLDPALLEFQLRGHRLLKQTIVEADPSAAAARDADLRVIAFWAAIYGFSSMRRKGVLRPHDPGVLPTVDIADAIVDRALLSALGTFEHDRPEVRRMAATDKPG